MANSQAQDTLPQTKDNLENGNDNPSVTDGGTDGTKKALEVAKSQLHETMAEVAENPPSQQPAPPPLISCTNDIMYEEPVPDPYNKAITYLERHNILQIFQSMTASIIYQKPENPLDFMITEIGEMKKHRDEGKSATKK